MWHENARGRESVLGQAIRRAHDLQKQSSVPISVYIFEDATFTLHVHKVPPEAGFTYLLVQPNGKVLFIAGLDSMLGDNVAEVLDICRRELI